MKFTNVQDYFARKFFSDLRAGFITSIVALPLAIAFAIASGVPPIMGLYTAIVAGILGSAFGGSKFSITGPTGAMAVIVLSTVNKYGLEGLFLAGLLAGIMQVTFGLIRMGKFVKFIPLPIISGFTAGIGTIIFIGQVPSFLGLSIASKERIWETIAEIFKNASSINLTASLIAIATLLVLIFLPKITQRSSFLKNIPPSFVALLITSLAAFYMNLSIPKIGEIPAGIPVFSFFHFNIDLLLAVLPAALTIAILGMLEALLCAVVCDSMTDSQHDSDKELISQGIANIVVPFFKGIPATAAVARSAVNIREGARTRFAGIYQALFLLLILLFFAPLAKEVPMSFLSGVLMFVSFRMINFREFATIIRLSKKDTIVLFATFLLTVFTDIVFAVQVGMLFAVGLLFVRMTTLFGVVPMEQYEKNTGINKRIYSSKLLKENVGVYTIHGPLFFGALSVFDKKINEHNMLKQHVIVLRMKHVSFIDSSGVERLRKFIEDNTKGERHVYLTTLRRRVKAVLRKDVEFKKYIQKKYVFEHTQDALDVIEKRLKEEFDSENKKKK